MNARASGACVAPCSHTPRRPPPPQPSMLLAEGPEPSQLHLSQPMESCLAHLLPPTPVDTIPPSRTPTPCQNSPWPSDTKPNAASSMMLCLVASLGILSFCTQTSELRLPGDSSATKEGEISGCPGLGLPSEPLRMPQEAKLPTAHQAGCWRRTPSQRRPGSHRAGLTWRKRTPVSVQ